MTETSTALPNFKLDHTMLRVKNLEKSLDFYTRILGMKILRQNEYPAGRFTNTFIGYTDEDSGTNLELTYNWDQEEDYTKGNAWGGTWRSRSRTCTPPASTSSSRAWSSPRTPRR